MVDCLFCGIVAGDVPAEVVARSDRAVAFRDINAQAPVHVLVVPVHHVTSMAEAAHDAETVAALFALTAQVARSEGLAGGWRVVTNVGSDAGQTVYHLHLHLLGGRRMAWPPG